jgi:exocyst complex component 2
VESRGGQLIFGNASSSQTTGTHLEIQQKRIVEKVWSAVEKIMTQMRALLNAQLREPSRSVEEQTKTIEYVQSSSNTSSNTEFF